MKNKQRMKISTQKARGDLELGEPMILSKSATFIEQVKGESDSKDYQ